MLVIHLSLFISIGKCNVHYHFLVRFMIIVIVRIRVNDEVVYV